MSDELKNILSGLNKDIEQEKLLQYLNRNLSDAEQHELEKQMNDDAFMSDAIEGLEHIQNKAVIPAHIQQLNAGLKKQLSKKKKFRKPLPSQFWIYVSIILLLILTVIAFVVIKKIS